MGTEVIEKDIVPTHLVISALRDNGYKNAAYAIAELMDNSIQADATIVELLLSETTSLATARNTSRINQIAVLDNGIGMSPETLRIALQFGNGTRLDTENQNGIGKFGMGLPNSSISQARRVEVWSWQNGSDQAYYSYLDVDEIQNNKLKQVPVPVVKEIPSFWLNHTTNIGKTGTLVVWSNLDRCQWKTARAIIDNSELLIGRMYRYFIDSGKVKIRYHWFNEGEQFLFTDEVNERYAVPNDPLYLMNKTSCPSPFDLSPMFDLEHEEKFNIGCLGKTHEVTIKYSIAKPQARTDENSGSLPHGKHAAKNVGVSIIRAGRELDLDPSWASYYDPRDRWWGVEISFPPALDEIFGVTNNKQSARYFSEMAKLDIENILAEIGVDNYFDATQQLNSDHDPRLPLIRICQRVKKKISSLQNIIKAQTRNSKVRKRFEFSGMESLEKATNVSRQRNLEGYEGLSDKQEKSLPPAERIEIIERTLVEQGEQKEVATQLATITVEQGLKFQKSVASLPSPAFFDVKFKGGTNMLVLNSDHPAYSKLIEILEDDITTNDIDELKFRLESARSGLELLLMAWARYEDEEPEGKRQEIVKEARWNWGKYARFFLET